jgi:phosphoserine phosphatase RsbU/P
VTPPELMEFNIVSQVNQVYLSWPEAAGKSELGPDEVANLFKTLRLREYSNESFYSVPDVGAYRLTVYLPFLSEGRNDLLLRSVFSMQSMRSELARLLRLGAAIVVLLLVIQAALGFFLYRLIVRPLKELRIASHITGRGEFYHIAGHEKRRDEIGILVQTFNKMAADIRDQKETIRKNFEEIKMRDDTMQHELMIAQHIQKSIFPKGGHPHTMALEYQPLYAVSGDFYDVYKLKDGSTGYLICDASGHGVPAALLTMMAKSTFAAVSQRLSEPGSIMAEVNRQMSTSLDMTGQYLTAFFIRIKNKKIQYCNGTHPDPIVLSSEGPARLLKSNGFYIGMMADTPFPFETANLKLVSGMRLVLYTDGITEARSGAGELYTVDRLASIAESVKEKSAAAIKDAIMADIAAFRGETAAEDDVTLLVLEI